MQVFKMMLVKFVFGCVIFLKDWRPWRVLIILDVFPVCGCKYLVGIEFILITDTAVLIGINDIKW